MGTIHLWGRPQASVEVEESRGDARQRRVIAPSPKAVLIPPREFANGMAMLARRSRKPKPQNAATFLRNIVQVAAGAVAVNVLPQSMGFRNALIIRNASTSAGSLLVGFGTAPTSVLDCDIELVAGGVVFQDYAPSQDDIWLFSSAGAFATVSYSIR